MEPVVIVREVSVAAMKVMPRLEIIVLTCVKGSTVDSALNV